MRVICHAWMMRIWQVLMPYFIFYGGGVAKKAKNPNLQR
tara:strand:- start:27 stop:143 length:117 start_codon:yes stop_codon:yes gene_type:complete